MVFRRTSLLCTAQTSLSFRNPRYQIPDNLLLLLRAQLLSSFAHQGSVVEMRHELPVSGLVGSD
jgi:hypothetical protein